MEKKFKETQKLDIEKLNCNEPVELQTDVIIKENEGEVFAKEDICTLRIRAEGFKIGASSIILKMQVSDTI